MGPHFSQPRSYGTNTLRVQRLAGALLALFCALTPVTGVKAAERPLNIVVLGDSLSAGFGLPLEQAFPAKLAAALKAKGVVATITNAGVSGDTASGGLVRLDWSVPDGTDAVIVELGANDALRGLSIDSMKSNLHEIIKHARAQYPAVKIVIAGMEAPPNLGSYYTTRFRDASAQRMAEQAAIGQDVIDLADALKIPRFAVAGIRA